MIPLKNLFSLLLLMFFSIQGFCGTSLQNDRDTLNLATAEEEEDTTEYRLVIFSAAFEGWFQRTHQPKEFYSQSYLEEWNKQLTDQWNRHIHSARRRECIPDTYIEYEKDVDYGKELNHRLFYFYRFMHEQCRVFSNYPRRW